MTTRTVIRFCYFLAVLCVASAHARIGRLTDGALSDTTITLSDCFDIAHAHNARLRSAAAAVAASYGEKIRSRGRFIPKLDLIYRRTDSTWTDSAGAVGQSVRDAPLTVELRQRIAEFGRTGAGEESRQDRERATLYAKELTVIDVMSTVRRTFRGLLVVQQQLDSHDSLLAIYSERLEQSDDRLDKGLGLRTAVLTARLNWLDERERILALRSRRLSTLAQLKQVLGLASVPSGVRFVDEPDEEIPEEDSCVALALERSTEIDDYRRELLQAGRALGQTGWEFLLGDITFSSGMYKNGHGTRVEMRRGTDTERRWVVDAVGTKVLDEGSGEVYPVRDTSLRFASALEISIPVFRGAQRHGTVIELGARYDETRAKLVETTRSTERRTREAYYQYRTSRDFLEIQRERVVIARERYSLAETQHTLGRMSDDGFDSFRERLFIAQDAYFAQQFDVVTKEEDLRALIRLLE